MRESLKYEAEMKEGILSFLKTKQNCINVVHEVDSGYGIADFVGIRNSSKRNFFYFKNKIDVFFLLKMEIDQPVHLDNIERNVHYSRKYLKNVILKLYKEQGLIHEIGKNLYVRGVDLDEKNFSLIAVEAKLSKWYQALTQAVFYKRFADYSIVALYKKFIQNVDLEKFRQHKIGLILIDDSLNFDVIVEPALNKDYYKESKLFVSGLTLSKEN
jgi:hypothetical protein